MERKVPVFAGFERLDFVRVVKQEGGERVPVSRSHENKGICESSSSDLLYFECEGVLEVANLVKRKVKVGGTRKLGFEAVGGASGTRQKIWRVGTKNGHYFREYRFLYN